MQSLNHCRFFVILIMKIFHSSNRKNWNSIEDKEERMKISVADFFFFSSTDCRYWIRQNHVAKTHTHTHTDRRTPTLCLQCVLFPVFLLFILPCRWFFILFFFDEHTLSFHEHTVEVIWKNGKWREQNSAKDQQNETNAEWTEEKNAKQTISRSFGSCIHADSHTRVDSH